MLREDSYVEVKPGYVDTAAVACQPIDEVPATPDDDGKKKKAKAPSKAPVPARQRTVHESQPTSPI